MSGFDLSVMQKDYWNNSTHRWNIKTGATGSGKTYLDFYLLPKRIRACTGKGLIVLLGNTKTTLERNILDPMREIYGDYAVGSINNENVTYLFGRKTYCLGADKVNQVSKIQGATIEYAYGDEVTTWNREVFEMLKSRLRCENSMFDGTCNPDGPNHFFKKFLDSDADIYQQKYTIDDNPFLPQKFVEELKKEYSGTIYYDRYINGDWTRAEGLLFPQFASNPSRWRVTIEEAKNMPIWKVFMGLDIGGTKSHSTFVATGIVGNYQMQVRLMSKTLKHSKGTVDPNRLYAAYDEFQKEFKQYYPAFNITNVYVDNEAQMIENGLRSFSRQKGYGARIDDCKKVKFSERTLAYNFIFNTDKVKIVSDLCPGLEDALSTMVYADEDEDSLLDDYTTDVDTYDADFYSWSRYMDYFYEKTQYGR
ncbi:MAG: PBSX family phage terminase large subunit [Pseudobutyrivibrio sp.]|nr:PBSX family phage terminase large subunit [Pseudobutyrivibrio sp.]